MSFQDTAKTGYIKQVLTNTVLFREGDFIPEMYVVLKGSLKLTKCVEGQNIVVREVNQGGFFGEMSLFLNEARAYSAITTTDSILMRITSDNIEDVITKNPKLAQGIMAELSQRIRKLKGILDEHNLLEQPLLANSPACPEPTTEKKEEMSEAPAETETAATTAASEGSPQKPQNETARQAPFMLTGFEDKGPEITQELLDKYCFNKAITCPVCGHKFDTFATRDSRLKQVDRTNELRTFFQDIEPMFFNIWTCPKCYYAMRKTEFEKLNDIQKKNLANRTDLRIEKYKLDPEKKFTYGYIIQTHYLAIECLESLGKKDIEEKAAGLMLNIAWIYDDLKEPEKALDARRQALAKYHNAYIFGTDRTDSQDQKIEYLLGTLSGKMDNLKDAKNYLFKVASRRNGHPMLKQLAQDGLEDIKKKEKMNG